MNNRFEARKRTTLDGKVYWCVYDKWHQQYSKYCCHREYKSKKECVKAINFWNKEYFVRMKMPITL